MTYREITDSSRKSPFSTAPSYLPRGGQSSGVLVVEMWAVVRAILRAVGDRRFDCVVETGTIPVFVEFW